MKKAKIYLLIQSVLCVLLAILLACTAIGICREGAVRQAENPLEPIYTRDKLAERLAPIAPLFLASLALTAAGLIRGVGEKPAAVRAEKRTEPPRSGKAVGLLRAALLAAALLLILAGIGNGSARDVFYKAARICTECVGLG